ncbi:MAG: DUF4836 family protein [Aureispira sp.]|nr:DUF4836 family protein [Aureispira sp.]
MKYIYSLVFCLIGIAHSNAQVIIDLATMIPEKRPIIITFRPSIINQKVSYSKIQAYPFVENQLDALAERLMPKNKAALKDILVHPVKYGVSDSTPVHLSMFQENGHPFTQLYFQNANATLLYRYLAKAVKKSKTVSIGSWAGVGRENTHIIWNKGASMLNVVGEIFRKDGESDKEFYDRSNEVLRPILKPQTIMPVEQSLAKITAFKTYQDTPADISLWINCKSLAQQYNEGSIAKDSWLSTIVEQLDLIYDGNYLAVHLFLEKGTIRIQTQLYLSPLGQKVAEAAQQQKLNKKMFKYIDATETLEYTTVKLDFKSWATQWYQLNNSSLNEKAGNQKFSQLLKVLGVFLDEDALNSTLKGDAMFVTTGINVIEKLDTNYIEGEQETYYEEVQSKSLSSTFTWLFSYYKSDNFTPFLGLGQSLGFLAKINDTHYELKTALMSMPEGTHIYLNKGILIITNDQKVVQNPSKGIDKSLWPSKTQQKEIGSSTYTSYYDIAKMAEYWAGITPKKTASFWKTIKIYFSDFELKTNTLEDNILPQEGNIRLQTEEAPAANILLEALQGWYDATQE